MNLIKAEKHLLEIILNKSFKYSEKPVFKLVSGRMSNYYINCKTTTLDPEAMLLIGHIFYNRVKPLRVNAIGGLTLGADPIAFATAIVSEMQDDAINAFVVRKKAKEHGLMKWIEGNVREGDKVVVVDDVVTTGQSTIEAVDRARESNLNVIKAIALVDRQEGGRENIEKRGVLFESIFTKDDLMNLYKKL
ncbi:MAG: orotate phosphoribosyltransferase [Planctomycetes bacterium RIFCSPHIGHO2_02_FULL_38_41]|nr:MAG: orotate phosphoribosyltransferase [Planctomycetes bacterium RIFCSPHIGHO2_02_FULL_38_41]OHB91500.1 MAG: orotate phosphoribosyltransferase [Planctomycetes bacterium RIFCSPHIGHO2_12_39_6]OHB97636.1 MAG: orotate phosphoribosyltransferase [Planctomycetes bacterium RIFCSPLOWO2_12_38_17]